MPLNTLDTMVNNLDYKYEDDYVNKILKITVTESTKKWPRPIFFIAPISEQDDKLLTLLSEEKIENKEIATRVLLIPYFTGYHEDGHWVGIVVRFENNNVKEIEYYDSLPGGEMTEKLRNELAAFYEINKNLIIKPNNIIKQNDYNSCGPCMIQNLINATTVKLTSDEIRQHHISLMENIGEGVSDKIENKDGVKIIYNSQIQSTEDNNIIEKMVAMKIIDDNQIQSIEDILIDGCIKDYKYFPRCEFKARYKGTTIFDMHESKYWGTYFRTTAQGGNADRIAKLSPRKTYKNPNLDQSASAYLNGAIKGPFMYPEYKSIFLRTKPSPSQKPIASAEKEIYLYDQLLEYKIKICKTVVKKFKKIKSDNTLIDVYSKNNYPCVMVQVDEFSKIENENNSLYKISMAYFVGITNYMAKTYNIPIELVNRAGFGHNIPSVSATGTSFRINVGIVPVVYAEILIKSLKYLDEFFLRPLTKKSDNFKLNFREEELKEHNKQSIQIDKYKIDKEKKQKKKKLIEVKHWNTGDNLYDVLCQAGDTSGKKVSLQLTRMLKYIDELTDYVQTEVLKKNISSADLANPLKEMLPKLSYANGKVQLINLSNGNNSSQQSLFFNDEENERIKEDEEFWNIIKNIFSALKSRNEEDANMKSFAVVEEKKVKNLYSTLEKVNLEFIINSDDIETEDGYGSSSDCEVDVIIEKQKKKFYSKKITLTSGMRAINMAVSLSPYTTPNPNFDTTCMFYQTGGVINKKIPHIPEKVRCIDLSHCIAAKNPKEILNLEEISKDIDENNENAIVLDYTSATTEMISDAIKLFILKVPVIFLVSSGIKNEQIGADMNPYGTFRIIARNLGDFDALCFFLDTHLAESEVLPKELHRIRKAYKAVGAVVTSSRIYTGERGYKCSYKNNSKIIQS